MPLHLQTAWEFQKRFACSILKWIQRSDEQKFDRFDLFENNVFGRVAQERAPSRLNRYSDPASLQKEKGLVSAFVGSFFGMIICKPHKNKNSFFRLTLFSVGALGWERVIF